MSSTIRAARTQDRASIVNVVRASGLFLPEGLSEVEAALNAFLTEAASTDRWLVTDTGTSIAATAYYAPERMTDGTWNLYLLAVHPDHQGQGRGTTLVRHVEQDLRQAGARVLLIETSGVPDFAGQRAFYSGLGYHEEARIRDFYEPGDDKVVYWKNLQSELPPAPQDTRRLGRHPTFQRCRQFGTKRPGQDRPGHARATCHERERTRAGSHG